MERMESQQIAIYFYQQIANGVSKAPYVERIGTPSLLTMTMPRKLCLTVKPNLHILHPVEIPGDLKLLCESWCDSGFPPPVQLCTLAWQFISIQLLETSWNRSW